MSYMITRAGGCPSGRYSAPIALCAGYGEFPGHQSEGAALVARNSAYQNTAYDVLGVCAFGGFSVTLDEFADMLNDVTGLGMKASDLETVSRRVLTLERLFNLLSASRAADDWLPGRFFGSDRGRGRNDGVPEGEFRAMRAEYLSRSAGTSAECRAPPPSPELGSTPFWGLGVRADGGRHLARRATRRHGTRAA